MTRWGHPATRWGASSLQSSTARPQAVGAMGSATSFKEAERRSIPLLLTSRGGGRAGESIQSAFWGSCLVLGTCSRLWRSRQAWRQEPTHGAVQARGGGRPGSQKPQRSRRGGGVRAEPGSRGLLLGPQTPKESTDGIQQVSGFRWETSVSALTSDGSPAFPAAVSVGNPTPYVSSTWGFITVEVTAAFLSPYGVAGLLNFFPPQYLRGCQTPCRLLLFNRLPGC